jgi:hypothetical protein
LHRQIQHAPLVLGQLAHNQCQLCVAAVEGVAQALEVGEGYC